MDKNEQKALANLYVHTSVSESTILLSLTYKIKRVGINNSAPNYALFVTFTLV